MSAATHEHDDPSFDGAPFREMELAEIAPMLSWSFGFPVADADPWLRQAGLDNVRVVRRGGAIDAGLLLIPMGQFFGGRSVPMFGIAGVATSVEARGTGAAIELMCRTLRELHTRVVALSTLYPATPRSTARWGTSARAANTKRASPSPRSTCAIAHCPSRADPRR